MDIGILVPIALFFSIAWTIKAVVDARVRHSMVQTNGSPELVASILQGDETRRRQASLRWGIVLVALGAGFGVIAMRGIDDLTPSALAVLLLAVGIGNLVAYGAARKFN